MTLSFLGEFKMQYQTTIAAIATPLGRGGVGVGLWVCGCGGVGCEAAAADHDG